MLEAVKPSARRPFEFQADSPSKSTNTTDPDFDPAQKAFYYARVIEIPSPRWTAYDAKRFAVQMPADVPMKTQERAYTSPIWYTPPG